MSTVAEIEAVLPALSEEELHRLEAAVEAALHARNPKIAAAARFRDWWDGPDELSTEEAEAFAGDIEAGRREMNQPPPDRWAS